MASKGTVFKRCGCRDSKTRKRLEQHCPGLRERRHGSWHYRCSVRDLTGRSQRTTKGGFTSRVAAGKALEAMLVQSPTAAAAQTWLTGRWLLYWLTTRTGIKPTTRYGYEQHVNTYLIPMFGKVRLADLTGVQLTGAFAEFANKPGHNGRSLAPGTIRGMKRTLQTALNAAKRAGLIATNPARDVQLVTGVRPHAQVWTGRLVELWRKTGQRPSVAVWTTRQLADFLDFVSDDPLFALWWLVALRGLRRGEAAGLRWCDVDLDHKELTIVNNRTTVGHQIVNGTPKSIASRRRVALDRRTVRILRAYRNHKRDWHLETGLPWRNDGFVFTRADGIAYHPNYFTHRLALLIKKADLPPVRLHDLRHGAASLAHEAGADLKTVQDQLGHSSIVLTADTYVSILTGRQRRAARASARLILATARGARAAMTGKHNPNKRPPNKTGPVGPASTPNAKKTAGQKAKAKGRKT